MPSVRTWFLRGAAGCLLGGGAFTPAQAAEPPKPSQASPGPEPLAIHLARWGRAGLQRIEIGQMVLGILERGSDIGPGTAWFHDGQSRYGWEWLARRHGVATSGAINRKRFRGPRELFDRLDRDGNGVIRADDFDWSEQSLFLRQGRMVTGEFRRIDPSSNGRITKEEWDAFFEKAGKGKKYLTPDDLRAALFPPEPDPAANEDAKQPAEEEPSRWFLLQRLAQGELGSYCEGPRVGRQAPDFTLATHDRQTTITLSKIWAEKPVILVFGSFT